MIRAVRIGVGALAVLTTTIGPAVATPMTQPVGNSTILGTTYDVSVLGNFFGSQSFNQLRPTITFTSLADATAAGNTLKATFGSTYDWNPFDGSVSGGRIAYIVGPTSYDYVSLCVTESGCSASSVNGPLTLGRDDDNSFTFIQFAATRVAVPEPSTLMLFCAGWAGAAALRRRKKAKQSA
jgi:hypothetical protein